MFGHDSLPSRVIRFVAKAPHEGGDAARNQMYLGHKYQNTLIANERERRIRVRELLASQPEVAAANAEVQRICRELHGGENENGEKIPSVLDQIAAMNSDARTRKGASKELRDRAAALRAELRAASKGATEARAAACERLQVELKAIDTEAHTKVKALRASSQLYHGNYLEAEGAAKGARKSKDLPQFKRWDGDGKAGTQIQGGLTIAEAMEGTDTRLRIRKMEGEWAEVSVRIASLNKKPVWATHKVRWTRDIPGDARIKWAYALRRRVGLTDHWSILLTVSRAGGFPKHDAADTGSVLVSLGWKSIPAGLRVATWEGEDGRRGEVVVPAGIVKELADCDGIQATRRVRFNDAVAVLGAWVKGEAIPPVVQPDAAYLQSRMLGIRGKALDALRARLAAVEGLLAHWPGKVATIPEELATMLVHMGKWKSAARLSAVVYWMREHRFDGDEWIYEWLEQWRKHDKHLRNYEAHRRRKYANRRKHLFRMAAVELRRAYKTCEMKKIDLPKLAKYPKGEDPERVNVLARWNQRAASPGLLAAILKEMGPTASGGAVNESPAPLEPIAA